MVISYKLTQNVIYTITLHNIRNNLPMAPEKIRIKDEMLSPIQLEIKSEYGIKVGITNKLVPNLMPKQKYAIYYRN